MLLRYLVAAVLLLSGPAWAGCYNLDDCFDVVKNDYTITIEGYMVRAEGIQLATDEAWSLELIKQQASGFVQGINDNDEVHWNERIDLDFDPDAVIDPLQFSKIITRKCKDGECHTVSER
ncbi:MAG: hypothetical protein KAG18_07440 [Sinobacterium sp.]|nr:hypothetical protein [Sinobacterium sp.]